MLIYGKGGTTVYFCEKNVIIPERFEVYNFVQKQTLVHSDFAVMSKVCLLPAFHFFPTLCAL